MISLLKKSIRERPKDVKKWERVINYPPTAAEFYKKAKRKLAKIENMFQGCSEKFSKVKTYLVDNEKTWEELFAKISNFTQDYEKACGEVSKMSGSKEITRESSKMSTPMDKKQDQKSNRDKKAEKDLVGGGYDLLESRRAETDAVSMEGNPEEAGEAIGEGQGGGSLSRQAGVHTYNTVVCLRKDNMRAIFTIDDKSLDMPGITPSKAENITNEELSILKRHLQNLTEVRSAGSGASRPHSIASGSPARSIAGGTDPFERDFPSTPVREALKGDGGLEDDMEVKSTVGESEKPQQLAELIKEMQ
eukprot:1393926-Amorphochlora_amoeboformis.AAC.1